jgi:manganese efflux pump family protein
MEVAVRIATLISWVLTASIGARMLRSAIVGGGLRRQRASKDGVFPGLLFAHFGLALTGLAAWICFVIGGNHWLAWTAVGLLMPAIGLGISTVTLWTPYPGPGGAPEDEGLAPGPARAGLAGPALVSQLPDEVLSSALTDEKLAGQLIDDMIDRMLAAPPAPARETRWRLRALIPAGHGIGALATFLLALTTTVTLR